jgi:large subunit ribosomal protein L33
MARKDLDIVYLIPEGQTRDSHEYHYTAYKKRRNPDKLRMKKYNPVSRKHEWFVEVKKPAHSK